MANLLTVEQYATLTQQHPNTIRRQLRAGRLHAFKKGRRWLIPITDVNPATLNRPTAISWAIAVNDMAVIEAASDTVCNAPGLFPERKKQGTSHRYMRFVVTQFIGDAKVPHGLFTAAYRLLHDGSLAPAERTELKTLISWFEDNLPAPDNSQVTEQAVFWYRTAAKECISRMWALSNLLQSHGYCVEIFNRSRPGRVAFSDNYQIAVCPPPRARIKRK